MVGVRTVLFFFQLYIPLCNSKSSQLLFFAYIYIYIYTRAHSVRAYSGVEAAPAGHPAAGPVLAVLIDVHILGEAL